MNPDNEPLEPIDPPDNTGGGSNAEEEPVGDEALAIDPPENTGGGR